MLLPFSNDCSNSGPFFIKLLGIFPVALSSLVEVYSFVSIVFGELFGLGHVSSWIHTDCMGRTGVLMQLTTSNRCNLILDIKWSVGGHFKGRLTGL